jgi:hypothetical protein
MKRLFGRKENNLASGTERKPRIVRAPQTKGPAIQSVETGAVSIQQDRSQNEPVDLQHRKGMPSANVSSRTSLTPCVTAHKNRHRKPRRETVFSRSRKIHLPRVHTASLNKSWETFSVLGTSCLELAIRIQISSKYQICCGALTVSHGVVCLEPILSCAELVDCSYSMTSLTKVLRTYGFRSQRHLSLSHSVPQCGHSF